MDRGQYIYQMALLFQLDAKLIEVYNGIYLFSPFANKYKPKPIVERPYLN